MSCCVSIFFIPTKQNIAPPNPIIESWYLIKELLLKYSITAGSGSGYLLLYKL